MAQHYLQRELNDRLKNDDRIADFLRNATLDGMWYWDLTDPEHEWMDERFWTTLGYDPATKPHLASAWQDIIHPDDLASAKALVGRHLADPNVPYDQIVRYRHANGRTVHIRCRGLAIREDDGTPTRLLGAHIDVTAERETDLLLHKSQKMANIGTWEVDLIGNTLYWNDITKRIHEVPEDFVPDLATGIQFYKEGKSREIITEKVNRAIEFGEPYDVELQLRTQTGRHVWVRAIGQPEFVGDKCVRLFGVFQDIDQRKRGEERLLNLSIVEAKAKEMEQFAYAASHDLREPLLTIKGFVDVIREDHYDELPAEVKTYLNTIASASGRMDTLIQGLLDYSRLSQVKQFQEVELTELIIHVLTDLATPVQLSGANISYTDLPAVMGYPLELKILLQNLLSNALKYRQPELPPVISITCAEDEHFWTIRVQDNGIGVPESKRDVIFELFRQLHQPGEYAGNGIGLANCKKIVELHGGNIWVEPAEEEGSVFVFTLSRVQVD